MLKLFLTVLVLIGIALVAMGINVFFRKVKFPEYEVGHNKKMRELGIHCTKCEEMKSFNKKKRFRKMQLDVSKLES